MVLCVDISATFLWLFIRFWRLGKQVPSERFNLPTTLHRDRILKKAIYWKYSQIFTL